VLAEAHDRYSETRSATGTPSEYDFVTRPLAAAVFAFRGFDQLSYDVVPAVRSYTVVDPFFGPIVFTAILTSDESVEIMAFADDPDYWDRIADEPE
jgi:hypothetical protein